MAFWKKKRCQCQIILIYKDERDLTVADPELFTKGWGRWLNKRGPAPVMIQWFPNNQPNVPHQKGTTGPTDLLACLCLINSRQPAVRGLYSQSRSLKTLINIYLKIFNCYIAKTNTLFSILFLYYQSISDFKKLVILKHGSDHPQSYFFLPYTQLHPWVDYLAISQHHVSLQFLFL